MPKNVDAKTKEHKLDLDQMNKISSEFVRKAGDRLRAHKKRMAKLKMAGRMGSKGEEEEEEEVQEEEVQEEEETEDTDNDDTEPLV